MSKIYYHFDNDGRCAAAIVKRTDSLISTFDTCELIEYDHAKADAIEFPELELGEKVFIVDLAYDETIAALIRHCIQQGAVITHIDHHYSGIENFKNHPIESENYVKFFKDGISGCMLTWVYSLMHEDERKNPESIMFDFTEDYDFVAINYNPEAIENENVREIFIPNVIRLIDDNDIWRHKFPESKLFALGSMTVDTAPTSDFWDDAIYNNPRIISTVINDGAVIEKFMTRSNASLMKNAFIWEFNGINILCVNAIQGNSNIFGDDFNDDKIDAVCKFGYDGSIDRWRYTFYSKETGADCSELVSKIKKEYNTNNGGGHKHAAGISLDTCIF